MKKLLIGLCVAATLAGVSSAACAADEGFYGAFDLGQSIINPSGNVAGFAVKKTDTAFRIGAGYQLNKNVGFEVNYADFGKLTASGLVLGVPVSVSSPVTGYGVAVVGTLPINDAFALTGKVGLESTSTKTNVTVLGLTASQSANKTNATFGIGIKYNLTPSVALRAQYEDFGKVGNAASTGEAKLSLISAGVTVGF